MADQLSTVNILIVDDRPEKLMALEAVLAGLGENIIKAPSGADALRSILRDDFAVILLDINMPGMDGFETASLIRRRRTTRKTPIIFMTAHADRIYLERSYSLGAVDYILTPFVPEVLRTKVSVFVDLFKKTQQVKAQAEAMRAHAEQLQRLNRAALAINSAVSLDCLVSALADTARDVVGAHHATAVVRADQPGDRPRVAVSSSARAAARGDDQPRAIAEALGALVLDTNRALRVTQKELEARPEWLVQSAESLAFQGFMAVPLTWADGRNMGAIHLSDKLHGDFSDDDETILVQLAQLASIAVQKCVHADAREANRLKDEFLATLSHELRTPLNAILGWTRLLRAGPLDPVRASRALEVIERNVAAQAKLIEELLDVSRIDSGKLRVSVYPIELATVVETAVDAIRPAVEAKRLSLEVSLDEVVRVNGDADRLQQVVSNLLSNALKFTRAGGGIAVVLRRVGAAAELAVRDTGEGIAPEFLPRVFERFCQADSSSRRTQGGLGIGLALVRHIVELHGGSVVAESPGLGRGSTFVVRLPALPALSALSAADRPVGAEVRADPRAGSFVRPPGLGDLDGVHVLLVEDEPDARDLLREVLSQHRAQVTAVTSAREALAVLGAARPHVLVSDLAMPGEDGYELIRTIRRRPPQAGGDLPALALTAHARKEDRDRALDAGFQMHAAKPIEPAALIAAVEELAERRLAGVFPVGMGEVRGIDR